MHKETIFVTLSVCLTVIGASAILARGGPLDPPQGPVTSTMKTLAQVEPRTPINAQTTPGDADSMFRIDSPGSYYLEGNLLGEPGKHAIEIASSNVSVDLMGHAMIGDGSLGAFAIDDDLFGAVVCNGSISGWDVGAIVGYVALDSHIHHLNIQDIGGAGIIVGAGSVVESCRVSLCEADGITSTQRVIVLNCTSRLNGGTGIFAGMDSQIRDCDASSNSKDGISVLGGGAVERCIATSNGDNGMTVGGNAVVVACRARANGADGIAGGENSSVTGCVAESNLDDGIDVGPGSIVSACTASNNSVGVAASSAVISGTMARNNAGSGIQVGPHSTVTECSAVENDQHGIVADGAVVTYSTASANGVDGIRVMSNCVVMFNTCQDYGQIGIHAVLDRNRIDGNRCSVPEGNQVGIRSDGAFNLIVRNYVYGVFGGYIYGPDDMIGDVAGTPVGADAWDNFAGLF